VERVPEPEIMDGAEQALAYAQADFADVNQGFVDRFVALWPDAAPARVLDLGCGPADIPIRLCRALPESTVCAVDAARSMLALGRDALAADDVGGRVVLVQAYLPDLPVLKGAFDALISNSLLHHLANPMDLWESIAASGKPGAPVLVCDLRRPESEAAAQQIVDDGDCSDSEILRRDFYLSLLAAYTPAEVRQQLNAAGLEQLEVRVISERHLLVSGRL
jgi:ubiquinone/menaquinone biosynthesis C-methylase UbiE